MHADVQEARNVIGVQVECSVTVIQTWGRRLAETKGGKRARVAVARKLAALLHHLWRSDTEFCWN